jgi:hypothetical protein
LHRRLRADLDPASTFCIHPDYCFWLSNSSLKFYGFAKNNTSQSKCLLLHKQVVRNIRMLSHKVMCILLSRSSPSWLRLVTTNNFSWANTAHIAA